MLNGRRRERERESEQKKREEGDRKIAREGNKVTRAAQKIEQT